jgi:membrane-bound PQQ-dependent dehydrogenase (glucose/quinate/shikimate family)
MRSDKPIKKLDVFPLTLYAFASFVVLVGLVSLVIGFLLAISGGSAFYLASGTIFLVSGVQLFRRRASALHLAALNFVITWIWAFAEVGLDGWALLPRVDLISVLLPLHYLPPIRTRLHPDRLSSYFGLLDRVYPLASVGFLMLITALVVVSAWMDASRTSRQQAGEPRPVSNVESGDWRHIGHDLGGTRFSGLSLINRDNVGKLTRVWQHVEPTRAQPRSGPSLSNDEIPLPLDEATPLQIDDKLFVCLADNTILALDAEDGRLRWRYDPQTDLTGVRQAICRGVAYFEDQASAQCPKRVLAATLDARLIALDADSGQPCQDFGMGGQISLKAGMGPFPPGMYSPTSPPTITQGLAIIGGRVQDNISIGEPSGVIRAFDVHSGRLVWAWDMGRMAEQTGEPPPGETYTRGTPNSWSFFSSDETLGLVYIPTGNSTPDFVGSYRKPEWEKYGSSVVALDVRTGQVRWSFQTVRHDLWDYDVASQPVLVDLPTENGLTPALIQPTKQGELFVLDRRDGKPLAQVIDKAVPQTDVAGEWTSKTQPFSVGMPSLSGQRLSETDMWGLSPLDQLWCRLRFRQLRYDGIFTPPSLTGSIQFPGTAGGMNWGSVSVDNARHLLFVPSLQMATIIRLIPREAAEKGTRYNEPQSGTPFAVQNPFFLTRLSVPCQRPPYAFLTAIDLSTKKIVWSRALGTAEDLGPFGIASHLPITIGAPPIVGGGIATGGDIIFIGAVRDRRLRAIDSLTGRELWSDKLPQGNQATPITYRAPRSGRQMVVIVSGGYWDLKPAPHGPAHVMAYALP